MPFVVHILAEDIGLWEAYEHSIHRGPSCLAEARTAGHVAYRLKLDVYKPELAAITLKSPARLESLVGQNVFCWINIEKGYLSEKTGAAPRVQIRLERLNRQIDGRRLLRLRVARIEPRPDGPPRVILAELGGAGGASRIAPGAAT
jgi:hypothetical protein